MANKKCTECDGKKFILVQVGIGFEDKPCPHCSGTGKEPCTNERNQTANTTAKGRKVATTTR